MVADALLVHILGGFHKSKKLLTFENSVSVRKSRRAKLAVNFVQFYALTSDFDLSVRAAQAVHLGISANSLIGCKVRPL